MTEIKWIKLDISIFDNRKIKQIKSLPEGNSIILIWLQLMCLAGSVNDYGKVYLTEEIPYTEQMLATAFGEPLATVQLALKVFEQFNMIEVIDDIIYISNWEKYQAVEGMEKVREQTRKRVANYRQKQKQIECNVTGSVTVTDSNAIDIDIEEDKDKEINISDIDSKTEPKKATKRNRKQFTPPTIAEIEAYIKEKGLNVNPTKFFTYFDASNWVDSTGKPVLNWKQKLIVWDSHENVQKPKKETILAGNDKFTASGTENNVNKAWEVLFGAKNG